MNRLLPLPPTSILAAQKWARMQSKPGALSKIPYLPVRTGNDSQYGTTVAFNEYRKVITDSLPQFWKILSPGMSLPSLSWLPAGVVNGLASIGPAWQKFAGGAVIGSGMQKLTYEALTADIADTLIDVLRNPSAEETADLDLFASLSGSNTDNTSSWSSPLSLGKFMLDDPYAALDRQTIPWGLDIAGVAAWVTWTSGGLVNGSIRDFWYSLRNFSNVIAHYPWPNPKFYFECAFRAVIGPDTVRLFVVTSSLLDSDELYDWITIEIMQNFKAMVSQVNDYVEDKQKRDAMSSLITKIFITAVTLGIGALASSAASAASAASADAGATAAEAAAAGSAITNVTGKVQLVTGLVGKKAAADAAAGMHDLADSMHEESPEFAAQVTKTAWRINPEGMQAKADEAAGKVADQAVIDSVGKSVDSVVKTISDNPIATAVAVTAGGILLYFATRPKRNPGRRRRRTA